MSSSGSGRERARLPPAPARGHRRAAPRDRPGQRAGPAGRGPGPVHPGAGRRPGRRRRGRRRRSRRCAASTAPARRSSPGTWPSGRCAGGSPPPRCRSPRPRRRCTSWRPSTGGWARRCGRRRSRRARCGPVLDSWLFTLESDATAADPGLAGRGQDAAGRGGRARCWSSGWPRSRVRTPAFAQALRAYRAAVTAGDGAGGRRAGRLAGRAAARRGRGQAERRDPGRARPLRRDGVPAGPAGRAPRRRAIPGCCWCWMRWRRCSGSAATSGTRRSTRCGS